MGQWAGDEGLPGSLGFLVVRDINRNNDKVLTKWEEMIVQFPLKVNKD